MIRDTNPLSGYIAVEMLRRLATLIAVLAVTAVIAPATAGATSRDVASTHTYLTASYTILHTAVSTWSSVEASIHGLDLRFHGECPDAGAGSPEDEEEEKLSYEVAGALWATGYHTDAAFVRTYVHTLNRLTWSNPQITHAARRLTRGLQEMVDLQVPDLCSDIHAWHENDFGPMPSDVEPYDEHVEAIDIHEIPWNLLTPYVGSAEKPLLNGSSKSPPGSKNLNSCAGRPTGSRCWKWSGSTSSFPPACRGGQRGGSVRRCERAICSAICSSTPTSSATPRQPATTSPTSARIASARPRGRPARRRPRAGRRR